MNVKRILKISMVMFLFTSVFVNAQTDSAKVVLITLDGLRWQELFSGADSLLIANTKFVNDTTDLKERFWEDSHNKRRELLFPFLWKKVSKIGQLYGNRNLGNKVDLVNTHWFSYPGYNEILTGIADDERIDSNDKINNPNKTVLELANENAKYRGKVAAFGSWDVFPYIINEERSGVPVNAGFEPAVEGSLTEREKLLNELQSKIPSPWSTVRFDAFTHHYALEYMKKNHPALIYISYGETDDFAHDGEYDAYLKSANTTDAMIEELWAFTQEDSFYKDNTLFIVTTDHGRGTEPLDTWRNHGNEVEGAGEVWLILFGVGIKPIGEAVDNQRSFSNQIAPTILKVLGIDRRESELSGKPLTLKGGR